jgi:predicted ABC-type ATPase
VAGPNGAGKSTIAAQYLGSGIQVISPDTIAEKARVSPGEAGKAAIRDQERALASRASFAIDTTFSGKRELDVLSRAKAAGFKVTLVFVGVDSPETCGKRIEERVAEGGHHVSTEDMERRYGRSLLNLLTAIPLVDRLYILDNTLKRRRLVLSMHHGRTRFVAPRLPEWVCQALPERVRTRGGLSR